MNRTLTPLAGLVFSASLATAAQAGEFNYNYIDAGFSRTELDVEGIELTGRGYNFAASFDLADHWHLHGATNHSSFDYNLKADENEIGLGYSRGIAHGLDLTASLSYVSAEISNTAIGALNADGYSAGLGLRAMAGERVELFANADFLDLGEGESEMVYLAGAGVRVTDRAQLRLVVRDGDEATHWGLTWRFSL